MSRQATIPLSAHLAAHLYPRGATPDELAARLWPPLLPDFATHTRIAKAASFPQSLSAVHQALCKAL